MNGEVTGAEGVLEVSPIDPGLSAVVALPTEQNPTHDGLYSLVFSVELAHGTEWASAGHVVAHDQYLVGHVVPEDISASAAGAPYLPTVIEPTVWRAPTDNDGVGQGWMSEVSGIRPYWLAWGLQTAELDHTATVTEGDDGAVHRRDTISIPEEWTDVPRAGLVFEVSSALKNLRWLGTGPDETYADRRSASLFGVHSSTVDEQYHPYVVPQEHAAHVETSWFELTDDAGRGIRVVASSPITFSARRHGDAALTKATTIAELAPKDDARHHSIEVHVDIALRGLGTAACGPDITDEHRVGPGQYELEWTITPVS